MTKLWWRWGGGGEPVTCQKIEVNLREGGAKSVQCKVEFWYRPSICSGAEEGDEHHPVRRSYHLPPTYRV